MSLPLPGTPAPDFTLPSTAGVPVHLAALRGQAVLLAFFPLAFTGTCTAEVCEFSEDYAAYEQRGAVVYPVSVDSVPTLNAFKAHIHASVDMLSDFRRFVSRLYGVLDEDRFDARRAYVLIDREGVVRWTWVESSLGQKRSTAELLAQLDALA